MATLDIQREPAFSVGKFVGKIFITGTKNFYMLHAEANICLPHCTLFESEAGIEA